MLLVWDDASPDKPNNYDQTLLCCPLRMVEIAVKILLIWGDINPGGRDVFCEIPLWLAPQNGHEGVVKIPLERDEASPDRPDNHSHMSLHCSAENG